MNLPRVDSIRIEAATRQYLGGRMSKHEKAQFETRMLKDPRIAREVEITRRMRDGLRHLRQTGELDRVTPPCFTLRARVQIATAAEIVTDWLTSLRPRLALTPRLQLAAAAAVVTVVAATALYFVTPMPPSTILAASAHEFPDLGRTAAPISYVLARRRTNNDGLVIPKPSSPGVIQLNILPTLPDAERRYQVELRRAEATSGSEPLARTDAGLSDQGLVPVFLSTSGLAAGRYVLTVIEPETSGRSPATTQYAFTLTSDHREPYRSDEQAR